MELRRRDFGSRRRSCSRGLSVEDARDVVGRDGDVDDAHAAAWALGLGTHLVLFGLGLSIGHALDETQRTWGLGRVWGMLSGVALGALAQMFLTPLYAALLFGDRPRTARSEALAIELFVAPRPEGAWAGLHGIF